MTTYNPTFVYICSALILIAIMMPVVFAVPTTGAVTAIGSNNVTVPVTGITGTEAWVLWGYNPGAYVWNTPNQTPTAGTANILIWGAPMMGATGYYAVGCDQTGCGNEVFFTTAAITPLPTTTFGAGYRNLTNSHFNMLYISPMIEQVYSPTNSQYGIPRSLLYGLFISLIFVGLWMRTRSIRICSSMGIMLGSLLFSDSVGLHLGVPGPIQLLGGLLMAAGVAGWVLALWLKK